MYGFFLKNSTRIE